MTAEIVTNKGTMKLDLYEKETPGTVANFAKLAKEGYYDGLKWHRMIPNFMIQGGCPNTREGATGAPGTGGPGYSIPCEVNAPNQTHDAGVIAMAHRGRNTGGSQFYIAYSRDQTKHLDGHHTVFGKLQEGESFDVLHSLKQEDTIDKVTIQD